MKRVGAIRGKLAALLAAFMIAAVATGCGGSGDGGAGGGSGGGGGSLTLGYIEWDENVANSNLIKILLEEDLGYSNVELQLADVGVMFEGTASGDLDAFLDVWMPNHENYISEVEGEIEHLDPWFEGETAYGIAVPNYMESQSLEELDQEVDRIVGIEPGAAFHEQINSEVIPTYDMDLELVESSTPAMLAELDSAYQNEEPIAFLGWSPHWMNAEYDFRYLEDPEDAQGDFNDPSQLSSIVRKDLQEEDPVAYTLISEMTLTEDQVNEMEAMIREMDNPEEGASMWIEENRDVVDPWIEAAEQAGQ